MQTSDIRSLSSIDYIKGLDGTRAIAVLMVILHHYLMPFSSYLAHGLLGKLTIMLAKIGWVGVDMFFVISGYLITKILTNRPVKNTHDYKSFIINRAWRLLPAYLTCLLVFSYVAFELNSNSKVLDNSASLWTLTSNIQSAFMDRTALMDNQFNLVHFWSLALEWHFYLTIPVLLWLFRAQWLVASILLIVALATRISFQKAGLSDNAIYAFTMCRLDAFAMGIFLSVGLPKIKLQYIPYLGVAGLMFFAVTLVTIAFDATPFKKIEWLQLYGYTLIAAGFALALCPIITNQAKHIVHILESRLLVAIGRRSYSLYIWHLVFLPMITQTIVSLKLEPYVTISLILLIAILFSTITTIISYRWIETRCYAIYHHATKRT
ncbi:MAG TPA: acyltransferase [Methylophilus sp.]|mgnify:CR=1 FL=1|nr:acyltransferase [Methylophilus sp.]HQQ33852.1 acyltransferase [Methylophilus sp.]